MSEHQIQVAYFDLVRLHMPSCTVIYSVPNAQIVGKYQIVAYMLAEGLVKGRPDVNIDSARGGYHGMRIEFKRDAKTKLSKEQEACRVELESNGYYFELHHDAEIAWAQTDAYLRGRILKQ